MTRRVRWFSAGAASAVATKLDVVEYPGGVIAYTDTGSEHDDNPRFIRDCEEWFGQEVVVLRSASFVDTWDVWERRGYIYGQHGAPCTIELKKKLRFAFERADDVQVFGYTAEEQDRISRFRQQNPDVDLHTPLADRGLMKSDCLAIVERAGIVLPWMYRHGYTHNNCIGCPKGGMGYWNKIRQDFPATFVRMSRKERDLDFAILKDVDGPVWLDELDPERGDMASEPSMECSLLCAIAEAEISVERVSS